MSQHRRELPTGEVLVYGYDDMIPVTKFGGPGYFLQLLKYDQEGEEHYLVNEGFMKGLNKRGFITAVLKAQKLYNLIYNPPIDLTDYISEDHWEEMIMDLPISQ